MLIFSLCFMIKMLQQGSYKLFETWIHHTKILSMDEKYIYAWINAKGVGEILVTTNRKYNPDCILSVGRYRIYDVKTEARLSDQLHLELSVGEGFWQGYLLPKGLPIGRIKKLIVPTKELITIPSKLIVDQVSS
jgi:hypothetical protein